MSVSERSLTSLRGRSVFLPDGRRLGLVHDTVVDFEGWRCSHLFVRDTNPELVEGAIHLAIPWRWVRAIDDIVLLREGAIVQRGPIEDFVNNPSEPFVNEFISAQRTLLDILEHKT